MAHNDYFFYIVVAASIVGSIVKAIKKKPEETQAEPRRNVGGDILKKLLDELGEKDDYIPRNPVPAPAAKPVMKQPTVIPSQKKTYVAFDRSKNAEMGYEVPEAKEKHSIIPSDAKNQRFEPIEEYVDPLMASIDLSSPDEMKKAIIYSEIFRTKF
jgi:hypothetical protein